MGRSPGAACGPGSDSDRCACGRREPDCLEEGVRALVRGKPLAGLAYLGVDAPPTQRRRRRRRVRRRWCRWCGRNRSADGGGKRREGGGSSSQANLDYLREIGATPVLYGEGVAARVQAAAGGPVDAVFDVAGKTAPEDLVSVAPEPSQFVTIANFDARRLGARATGGGSDSHPAEALP